MKNRRSFFKKSLAVLSLLTLNGIGNESQASKTNVKMKSSFIHQVYFWLKNPNNTEARKRFEAGLKLMDTIPQIRESHTGIPPEAKRAVVDGSFTYSYLVIFDNKEDHDIYQKHEIHLKFIEDNSEFWEKVQVFDSTDV